MFYTEKERKTEIKGNYDVIVAGSGPAGMAAAVTAARNGAKTLLIEYCGDVGGVSTSGLMSHFTGTVNAKFYTEILTKMAQRNPFRHDISPTIDPEILKNIYMEMLDEAGVDLLLYTLVCDVIMEGNRLCGVITENKTGRFAYTAKVIIDATGDGDVACKAGAEYTLGREDDHKMQPCTIMFKVGGVDTDKAVFPPSFETTVETPKGELQALGKEKLPYPAGHVLLYPTTLPGVVTCNMTNCTEIDGTKAEDLTKATFTCRSQLEKIVAFLREYAPGYENCYLLSSASLLGVRETRHFKGVKTLGEEDILSARVFEDWVVRDAHFNFDIHNIEGAGLDKNGVQHEFKQEKGYTIPYGCLVPVAIDGLLLSGRNISGTHLAHSNFRAMPICVGIGEAGGAAASIAVKTGCQVRDVPVAEIQKILL